MYALYEKWPNDNGYRYRFVECVSLFGCNNGYSPWLLVENLPEAASEPLPRHLSIGAALRTCGLPLFEYFSRQAHTIIKRTR